MLAWKTTARTLYTSSQNDLSLGHAQNMCKWLPMCAPQLLQHLLLCVGPIFATICGVRKYLVKNFNLNSLHVFELVTKCASEQMISQFPLDIAWCISASHLCLICTELFGFKFHFKIALILWDLQFWPNLSVLLKGVSVVDTWKSQFWGGGNYSLIFQMTS